MSGDTIETQILTYKDLKIYQEKTTIGPHKGHHHQAEAQTKAKKRRRCPPNFLTASYAKVVIFDTSLPPPRLLREAKTCP